MGSVWKDGKPHFRPKKLQFCCLSIISSSQNMSFTFIKLYLHFSYAESYFCELFGADSLPQSRFPFYPSGSPRRPMRFPDPAWVLNGKRKHVSEFDQFMPRFCTVDIVASVHFKGRRLLNIQRKCCVVKEDETMHQTVIITATM